MREDYGAVGARDHGRLRRAYFVQNGVLLVVFCSI